MEEFIQKQSILHISAESETNKLLASWRLVKYYARKRAKITLQSALYRWSHNISAIVSKGAKGNKLIANKGILLTNADARRIENRNLKFKAFLFRTKRCYKRMKVRNNDIVPAFDNNAREHGNQPKKQSSPIIQRCRKANEDYQIDLVFPDVFMKKVRINSKVRVEAPLNFKFVSMWFNDLFKKHAYIKTRTIFDLDHVIGMDDFASTAIDDTVENFIESVLNIDKLDAMPHYLVKTPVQHNIKLLDHGLKYENELNASAHYPLWEKSCAFVRQYRCKVSNLFRLGLICLELLTRTPHNFTVNMSAYQERRRDTIIRTLLQAILCRLCLYILDFHHGFLHDGEKVVSKPISSFRSEFQINSAKEQFIHFFEPMIKGAYASPELQEAVVVRDVKPFGVHTRSFIAQKENPYRMSPNDSYIYSTTDPNDHAVLYKVEYKNSIESCPMEMYEKIRFNIVGRSYIYAAKPGTEKHVRYVKCFPNVTNMIQRSFYIWKNASSVDFYTRMKQKTSENAKLIRYNLKPACDMSKFETIGLKVATRYVQSAFNVKAISTAAKSLQNDIAHLSEKLNSSTKSVRNLMDVMHSNNKPEQ